MSTIDPGIEENIKETANDVDPNEAQRDLDNEEREDFSVPNRWWFASVGSPLLAGTFGPMATGFNIMALVYHWRQTVPPGGGELEGHIIDDPPFVLALNAVSLACAVIANASLLLNMAKRVKFAIAQPITIVGFLLGSAFLIADLCALGGAPHYDIQNPSWQPNSRHALTQAFYYGIFAAVLYMIIGLLMCWTVYGALRGHYEKQFHLTLSQRSLMLQTMSFITYLLLGGTVYCHIEPWEFLDAVYWADVTILTVGLGDYSPTTKLGKGLLFPFAIGGILILGLVIGSIRSLVLERGREKMSARMLEKRRFKAVHNVDAKNEVVKISMFSRATFVVDPNMCAAEKREQEFHIMRKVQKAADSERRYFALANSGAFALGLWFIGALVFEHAEYEQGWSYFQALYFSYTSLLTIGYGTPFVPKSNSGRAFFVFWSLLAVPSLTIVISNMGDTIVKGISSLTNWVSKFTVLPDENGFRASLKEAVADLTRGFRDFFATFTGPGLFGLSPVTEKKRQGDSDYENKMLDRLAERLDCYIDDDERGQHLTAERGDKAEKDIQFYHYVLARECRNLQKDIGSDPNKQYSWTEWEYYLKLMGDENDPRDFPGQEIPDIMVPEPLIAPEGLRSTSPTWKDKGEVGVGSDTDGTNEKDSSGSSGDDKDVGGVDGNIDRQQSVAEDHENKRKRFNRKAHPGQPKKMPSFLRDWSWLSDESPLLSNKSEAEWILERLSAALERELNRQRKGYRTKPPITRKDAQRRAKSKGTGNSADDAKRNVQQRNLEKAEKSEV